MKNHKHKVSGALRDQRPDLNDLRPTITYYPAAAIYSDRSGVRRRDRRPVQIAELKANRKARLQGGGQNEQDLMLGKRGIVSKIKNRVQSRTQSRAKKEQTA